MKTILLIDDDPETLITLADTLERSGYNVIPKPDAESALSLVREGTKIDLVITDLRMLGMSGSEFVTILKRVVPTVPVIMLTACGNVETYFKPMISGVFEYINKPVKVTELRLIVKAALDLPEAQYSATES